MAPSDTKGKRHLHSLPKEEPLPSEAIRQRLQASGIPFASTDSIHTALEDGELGALEEEVTARAEALLKSLIIDTDNDPHSKETARRIAKMLLRETFRGRYEAPPKVTAFPNSRGLVEPYLTGPITLRSTCAHHHQPIRGRCYVSVLPGKEVIGLSKFNRLVNWVASRPQIQEELTEQIADIIEETSGALGVAVMVSAEHLCMTHRGVKAHDGILTTMAFRGRFLAEPSLKEGFFGLLRTQGASPSGH